MRAPGAGRRRRHGGGGGITTAPSPRRRRRHRRPPGGPRRSLCGFRGSGSRSAPAARCPSGGRAKSHRRHPHSRRRRRDRRPRRPGPRGRPGPARGPTSSVRRNGRLPTRRRRRRRRRRRLGMWPCKSGDNRAATPRMSPEAGRRSGATRVGTGPSWWFRPCATATGATSAPQATPLPAVPKRRDAARRRGGNARAHAPRRALAARGRSAGGRRPRGSALADPWSAAEHHRLARLILLAIKIERPWSGPRMREAAGNLLRGRMPASCNSSGLHSLLGARRAGRRLHLLETGPFSTANQLHLEIADEADALSCLRCCLCEQRTA